jgi:hypothetical protein
MNLFLILVLGFMHRSLAWLQADYQKQPSN